VGRHFQLEEFDQPQPPGQREPRLAQPGPGQRAERIATAPAPEPTLGQAVDDTPLTARAKSTPLFVTQPPHQTTGRGLAPDQLFERLNTHGTSLNLVPIPLQSPYILSRQSSPKRCDQRLILDVAAVNALKNDSWLYISVVHIF
jgi:hypothetical protein